MSYYLEKNTEMIEEFFKRCAPFAVGDLVEITTDIDFDKAYGWKPSSHFLKRGDRAVVKEVDFYKGLFRDEVEPLNQTWIDREGNHNPVKDKHIFYFHEEMCRRVYPGDCCRCSKS
jgi:hypothetical protein